MAFRAFDRRVVVAALAGFVPAAAQSAPGWDGVWGRSDGIMITVRGRSVIYQWQGSRADVRNLAMTPDRLSFSIQPSGRSFVITRVGPGDATLVMTTPGQGTTTIDIRRQ